MLQLASIESSRYGDVNQRYIAALRQASDFQVVVMWALVVLGLPRRKEGPIGWITGDLSPHPVSRFLLGFLMLSTKGKCSISII